MNENYVYDILKTPTGYCFRLLPNNSRTQPIGLSVGYQNMSDCKNALYSFKQLIIHDITCGNSANHVKIERDEERKFYFVFHDDNNHTIFYRDKHYQEKRACHNAIRQVIENIEADLKLT